MSSCTITPVSTKREREEWVDLVYVANRDDPNFVPQLREEELEKFTMAGVPIPSRPSE